MINDKHSGYIEMRLEDLETLKKRINASPMNVDDKKTMILLIENFVFLSNSLLKKNISIQKLRRMIFGEKTESSKNILKRIENEDQGNTNNNKKKKKQKGHGRNGASVYTSAEKIKVVHTELKSGDSCPECPKGKLYPIKKPQVFIRITGNPAFTAKAYELYKLRCNLCGTIFTPKLPEEAGERKYDEKARAMIPILRYGNGFPFNRIKNLQHSLGIPFPITNQWDLTAELAGIIDPIYKKLLYIAAQAKIIHNDDTNMKISDFIKENKKIYEARGSPGSKRQKTRTGTFTSGFISIFNNRKIALFFTGRNHAGENIVDLLKLRAEVLTPPIHMCDALSRNTSNDIKTFLAHCLAHGRRSFADLIHVFPDKCEHVIRLIAEVYKNEKTIKDAKMSDKQRLYYHKKHSLKIMNELHAWFKKQFEDKEVEPNSSLGEAITYMLKYWKELTLFLKKEGAPIDNNIVERALKMSIMHRKNSLFYKTLYGAHVGDMFMSIIHTCRLAEINPFDYLVAVQKNVESVKNNSDKWLPWNYQQNLVDVQTA